LALRSYNGAKNTKAIMAAAPDIFEALPGAYDRRYKNPCWMNVSMIIA
jgi:hypothetical protein